MERQAQGRLRHGEHWKAEKMIAFSREQFAFELEFAKVISRRKNVALLTSVKEYTWMLKNSLFHHNNKDGGLIENTNVPVEEDLMLEYAYQKQLEKTLDYSVDYERSWTTGARFGCFSYDNCIGEPEAMGIHFLNAEYGAESPLSENKTESRKSEVHDVLSDIALRFPYTQEIRGKSWLYNLPAYRQFFPESYIAGLVIDTDESQWGRGSTIWGQLVDSQMQLKTDKAKELLRQVSELPSDVPLSVLYEEDGVLLPPLTTSGPIGDFYTMYDVTT